jgi:endonuclease-3 related protein
LDPDLQQGRENLYAVEKTERITMAEKHIMRLYRRLRRNYGKPEGQWKMWCRRPKNLRDREEVVVGAVLTQNTNWKNVEYAVANLKKEGICSLEGIVHVNKRKLRGLIRPSRFYNQKAEYLKRTAKFIHNTWGGLENLKKKRLPFLKGELTAVKGLGKETADSIILYALDKPAFVIDAYTKRLAEKLGLAKDLSYSALQNLFESSIPKDYGFYQDFHALIVIDGKA